MVKPDLMRPEELDLETLIGLTERLAEKDTDGHLTLMRFTTGWKALLRTPDLDTGSGRKEVASIKMHETLKEALVNSLLNRQNSKE